MNKQQKKFYIILSIMLALVFTTKAFASLTFTTNAITGTSASTIDLGAGNTLSLQTVNNGKILLGTGNVGIGNTAPQAILDIDANHDFQFLTSNSYAGGGAGPAISTKYAGLYMGLASGDPSYGIDVGPIFPSNNGTRILSYDKASFCFTAGYPTINCLLYANNNGNLIVGFGGTSPSLRQNSFVVNNGHYVSSQTTAPVASVTGTGYSGASMGTASSDTKGTVTATVGANAGTIVITFNQPYLTNPPVCTTDANSATAQVDLGKMYSTTSTTALTLNFVASPTGGSETWSYICVQ